MQPRLPAPRFSVRYDSDTARAKPTGKRLARVDITQAEIDETEGVHKKRRQFDDDIHSALLQVGASPRLSTPRAGPAAARPSMDDNGAVGTTGYGNGISRRHINLLRTHVSSTPVATTAGTLTVDGEVDLTGTDDEGDTGSDGSLTIDSDGVIDLC